MNYREYLIEFGEVNLDREILSLSALLESKYRKGASLLKTL